MSVYLGAHTSISNGTLNGMKYIESIGGNVSQIFLGNKLSSQLKYKTKLSAEEIKDINQYIKTTKHQLVVHAPYVVNLCSKPPSSQGIQYQLDSLKHDLELGDQLGFVGLVVHIGSQLKLSEDEAYQNMAKCIQEVINRSAGKGRILLETPAGQGTQIATDLDGLAKLWRLFPTKYHARLGICLDTCHVFSSGEPLHTSKGVKDYMTRFDKLIGLKHLVVVHLNDSKMPLNSRKDRHENLTEGYIYGSDLGGDLRALKTLMEFLSKQGIPALLETPGDGSKNDSKSGSYQSQFQLIQKLVPAYKKLPKATVDLATSFLAKKTKKTKSKTTQKGGSTTASALEPNKTIIETLSQLGQIYQARKELFRARAYSNASLILREHPKKITSVKDIEDLPKIGKGVLEKVQEILDKGYLQLLKDLQAESIPSDQRSQNTKLMDELTSLLGVGPEQAKKFIKDGIKGIKDLENRVNKGEVTLNHQQAVGLKYNTELKTLIPRKDAHSVVLRIFNSLSKKKEFKNLELIHAGSYPSGKVASKDIDMLIFDPKIKTRSQLDQSNLLPDILEYLTKDKKILETLSLGKTKFLGLVPGTPGSKFAKHLDIRLIPLESRVPAYFYYTSGGKFNQMIRQMAKNKGYTLSEWDLKDSKGQVVQVKSEDDIFKAIGVNFIPMSDRRKIV